MDFGKYFALRYRIDAPSSDKKNFFFWEILSLAFLKYSAFISIRKEAINKIQTHSRSRTDAPSSDKIFLFRN